MGIKIEQSDLQFIINCPKTVKMLMIQIDLKWDKTVGFINILEKCSEALRKLKAPFLESMFVLQNVRSVMC